MAISTVDILDLMTMVRDSVIPDWGFSIIVLTIMVRLLLFIPSRKQTQMNLRMMEIQKKLKPELDKLHEKYKDDFQTYNREKTRLMMQHGMNPFAAMGGFDRPILHGLCTYGFTGRALLHRLCGGDPARFHSMEGRFSSPVLPGERLTVRMWETGAGEVWVTHGQEDALVHWCTTHGIRARPLHMLGYGDEGEAEEVPHPPLEGEGRERSEWGGVETPRPETSRSHPTSALRAVPPPQGEDGRAAQPKIGEDGGGSA